VNRGTLLAYLGPPRGTNHAPKRGLLPCVQGPVMSFYQVLSFTGHSLRGRSIPLSVGGIFLSTKHLLNWDERRLALHKGKKYLSTSRCWLQLCLGAPPGGGGGEGGGGGLSVSEGFGGLSFDGSETGHIPIPG